MFTYTGSFLLWSTCNACYMLMLGLQYNISRDFYFLIFIEPVSLMLAIFCKEMKAANKYKSRIVKINWKQAKWKVRKVKFGTGIVIIE